MRALIIESSRLYHRILSQMLRSYDFSVTLFESAQSALNDLDKHRYDLICVSMHLPDSTGVEVCEAIRRNKYNAETPILIITSETNASLLSRGLSAGATDIIRKDELTRLEERLHSLIPLGPFRYNISGRALYLEDSLTIAKAMDAKLNRLGLDMDHVFAIEEALEQVEKHEYDLIMTDIVLQGSETGIDFIEKLRIQPRFQRIPILAVTGVDSANRRIQALRAGANDYLTKPVLDEEIFARINNLVSSKRLIDQLTRERQRLMELATTDHLTGLCNRHFLVEVAKRQFADAYKGHYPLSLLVLDVDDFKQINDCFGHNKGDMVLKHLGKTLTEFCQEGDFVARFGGEEFVLLLTHCEIEEANKRAESLRKTIEQLRPQDIALTASIGTTCINQEKEEYFDAVFSRADRALYQAKAKGRNQVVCLQTDE